MNARQNCGEFEIRPYRPADEESVVALWTACGLTRPWNDPVRDIARKRADSPDGFFVAAVGDRIVGSVMAGYDGHRGWINYLGVHPEVRRRGIARALVEQSERYFRGRGCPKINLQVRGDNAEAAGFYGALGYGPDDVMSFGKRLEDDCPPAGS